MDTEQQPICPLRCKECGTEYEVGFNDSFCSEQCANRYINGLYGYRNDTDSNRSS